MFENWSEVKEALLEGLDTSKKSIVGTLLENQKQHILTETAAAGAVAANDIAGFRKILIPMIRRIIPGTIATELVGVQPMQGPVGLVYTMRYRYGESVTQPGTAFYPTSGNIAAGDEMFGNNPALRQFYSGAAGLRFVLLPIQTTTSFALTFPKSMKYLSNSTVARGYFAYNVSCRSIDLLTSKSIGFSVPIIKPIGS